MHFNLFTVTYIMVRSLKSAVSEVRRLLEQLEVDLK